MSMNHGFLVPLEILQGILLLLDFESFYLASLTCSFWRSAALSTPILRRQLRSVPGLSSSPASLIQKATAQEIRALYQLVCRQNLIGLRRGIEYAENVCTKYRSTTISDISVRSRNGVQSAQLRGLTLTLDAPRSGIPTAKSREVQLNPTLYPSADAVKQITNHAHIRSFVRARSFARMQFAISQCGGLVAVALGQKLHVYALPKKLQHVEVAVSDNVLDSIQSIEFTDDDGLIRCEIDGVEGSYVRYLGHQRCRCYPPGKMRRVKPVITPGQKMSHWHSGLRNVYLDSADIETGLGGGVSLHGIRIVNAPRRGEACVCRTEKYFFALLRERSCEGRYVVGHVSVEGSVDILQQIPARRVSTYPESLDETIGAGSLGMQLDRWDIRNLPRAHSPNSLLSVSHDGKLLAVFEPPHGQAQGTVYICSASASWWDGDAAGPSVTWPFAIGTLDHELDFLDVKQDENTMGYFVVAQSQAQIMEWRFQGPLG
ncbi:hypothetical protein BJX63DRAFT_199403 [Aspergillus granulosus]|uniref:F-box domain-containing protein n=1 Tax=Aspergillus granulosus TaxID=176169 RepID=A0ABR4HG48_9EURO